MEKQNKKLVILAPKVWTWHHAHRIVHISGFFCAVALLMSVAWVFGSALGTVLADTQLSTGVGVTIAGINEGPVVVLNGGSGSGEISMPPTNTNTPPSIPPFKSPVITPEAIIKTSDSTLAQRTIKVGGVKQTQFIFIDQYPKFSGHTNIQNALINIDIASTQHVKGSVHADSNGDWSWKSFDPIMPGNHTLTVTATDELEPLITSRSVLYFAVELPPGQVVKQPSSLNSIQLGNGGNLFDVTVDIPDQFKIQVPGDEVVAKVKLVNFGSEGHPVDVEVQYVIRNSAGDIIIKNSQTVAVATQLSFLKSFVTSPALPTGLYTLTVSVPSQDLIATATDFFELRSKTPVATTTSSAPPIDYSILFQILTALLLLFTFIGYLEYNKVQMLSRTIKQITEEELIDQV